MKENAIATESKMASVKYPNNIGFSQSNQNAPKTNIEDRKCLEQNIAYQWLNILLYETK